MVYRFHLANQIAQTNSRRWSLPSLLNNHLYDEQNGINIVDYMYKDASKLCKICNINTNYIL